MNNDIYVNMWLWQPVNCRYIWTFTTPQRITGFAFWSENGHSFASLCTLGMIIYVPLQLTLEFSKFDQILCQKTKQCKKTTHDSLTCRWIFRSQDLAPHFSVIPATKSKGQTLVPPIYSIVSYRSSHVQVVKISVNALF